MADEETQSAETGDEGAAPAPKKGGGIGALLPFILKWVAIVIGAIALIVTVVLVTMKIAGGNNKGTASMPVSEEYRATREIFSYYQLDVITTKTSDAIPAQVMVKVSLGYKLDDKATPTEITQRKVELIDFLRQYFTERSSKELKPKNEEQLKKDIKDNINDRILSNTKIKDVRFTQFDVIEQS